MPTGAKKSEKAIDLIHVGKDDGKYGDDYGFYENVSEKSSLGVNKFDPDVAAP